MSKDEPKNASTELSGCTAPEGLNSDPQGNPDQCDKPGMPLFQTATAEGDPDEHVKPGLSTRS